MHYKHLAFMILCTTFSLQSEKGMVCTKSFPPRCYPIADIAASVYKHQSKLSYDEVLAIVRQQIDILNAELAAENHKK